MESVIVVKNVRSKWKVGDQLNGSTGTQLSSGSNQLKFGLGPVWTHDYWFGKFANIYFSHPPSLFRIWFWCGYFVGEFVSSLYSSCDRIPRVVIV